MPDFEQDIIRRVRIETQVDTDTIKQSSAVLDSFYRKYQQKDMQVDTSDFFRAVDAVRLLRKELDATKKSAPHMEGIIGAMSSELARAGQEFERAIIHFTNGDIAHGLNEAVDKIASGLAIRAVDLGDFLSTTRQAITDTVDALKQIGAIKTGWNGKNFLGLNDLNVTQLQEAIALMRQLEKLQAGLESFEGQSFKGSDLYSGTPTNALTSRIETAQTDLEELRRLNLETMNELSRRRSIVSDINSGSFGVYEDWTFQDIKEEAKNDKRQYENALSNLQEYITERESLLEQLRENSNLFTASEFYDYSDVLGDNLSQAKRQLQELQQIGRGSGGDSITGDFSEIAEVLGQIQTSLKIISDVFQHEKNSMKEMADSGKTSFESLSQAIVGVYNNLAQVQELVDEISQKDFNITNITNPASASTSASKRQSVKQLKTEVEAEMKHVKVLFQEFDALIQQLQSKGMFTEVMHALGLMGGDFSSTRGALQMADVSYDSFEQTMLEQMGDAKTKAKIENLLVQIDGYITKLQEVNKLREKYGLGTWQDPLAQSDATAIKPEAHIENANAIQQEAEAQKNLNEAKQTEIAVQGNVEAQQMSTLKGAIDEVSKAIGRKNAGFIKEKEIVDNSVEAEKAKLRELIDVITNEIGTALDGIKVKFAQAFAIPELDKGNLQASFDEAYNKFIELKDKIGTMKIDVGINADNLIAAIQQALYAKEIEKNFEKITFEDVFEEDIFAVFEDNEKFKNLLTGEIVEGLSEAQAEFDKLHKGKWKDKNSPLQRDFLTTQQMLDRITHRANVDAPKQDNWAQVIVEAINTQGGNIVEAIKIVLPKSLSGEIGDVEKPLDEAKLSNAFNTLSQAIISWNNQTGKSSGAFFRSLEANRQDLVDIYSLGNGVAEALRTLGLINDLGKSNFIMPDTGLRNLGVVIADQIVGNVQDNDNVRNIDKLQAKLNEASQLGAAVPRILSLERGVLKDQDGFLTDVVFQLQTRVPGENVHSSTASKDFLGASPEQIDRLIHTFETLEQVGLFPDFVGDNILFDKQKGFSLVDLDTRPMMGVKDADDMVNAFIRSIHNTGISPDDLDYFSKKVRGRFSLSPKERLVNADTIAAEQATRHNQTEAKSNNVKLTPTMDEGAVAQVVAENVAKTPVTVKVTPVVDSASDSEQAVNGEAQSAVDAAKSFVDAANAKKQFVEANKQVAEGAKESTQVVKEEAKAAEQAKQTMMAVADDTIQPSNWDRVTQLQTDHGEDPFALSRSKTDNVGDKSVRTIVESWTAIRDEDGALTGDMELNTVKIINDFKKRTDAITKENEKIKTAQAYLQKFLTQFNNKTMGKGSLLAGYQDLANLANSSDFKIDDIAKAEQMMSNLDAEYNKVVQSMRKGSASMNPFVNAINSMDKMEDVLLNISLQFRTLNEQPEWLKNQIIDLYKQLDNVSAETDIYKFAEGFGNLRVSINSVTESIRQQRLEQKLTLSDFNALVKAIKARDDNTIKASKQEKGSDWERYYSDRAAEQQKIVDAIRLGVTLTSEQEAQLSAMSEKHALMLKDISLKNTKIEEQKQKYEEIVKLLKENHANQLGLDNGSIRVVDKDAYRQRLDAERAQIDALIKGADLNPEQTKSVQDLVKLIADLRVESSNIDLMSKKWAEQNLLTDEAKVKIEALKQALLSLTSGSELSLWKKQWKELTNEMAMASLDAKEDKQIGKLLEDDRKAQVKEYIDLLKIMHDYEQRATKEAQGSDMQTFYNNQVAKVKEHIDQIDIKSLENQDEKNKRLAIEEAHQRAIAEILERQNANEQKSKMLMSEEEKIQKKYESGYLSEALYNDWQKELAEYRNYMTGVTKADEATIQDKKKHLMQLYDTLTKMSNASKSFFTSSGEILPQNMWLDKTQLDNVSASLHNLYQNIVTERFVGMQTAVTGVNDKLGQLNFTVDDGAGSLSRYTIDVDGATGATKLLHNATKPTLTILQQLGQTLKKDFTGLLHSIMGGSGIHAFVKYMRQGIQSVRELDLALTELKKVTDETEATYDEFLETAAKTGERIGSTISNVTSATAEFAKLGYGIAEAASMAEAALVYTNVGDNIDVETGSQSIISTLKAFGIEASNTMSIVDSFNEVGNNFAITTKGIGDALQVSASAMASAGNSMHESIGLITAANTVVNLCHVIIVI